MSSRISLTRIAKLIVKDHGKPTSTALRESIRQLETEPSCVFDLIELLTTEGAKKRPDHNMAGAYGFLLAKALEFLRYGVERNNRDDIALVEQVRASLLKRGRSKQITPETLQIVLQTFAVAKLEMGNDLRELLQELALSASGNTDDTGDGPTLAGIGGELAADLRATESVSLKSTARIFGNIEAKNLVVESGAVFVGRAKIGLAPAQAS